MIINIKSEKKKLIEWISDIEDESILRELQNVKDHSVNGKDWWDELSDDQKISIERGLKDSEEGRVVPYEQFKDDMTKWLTKLKSPMKQ